MGIFDSITDAAGDAADAVGDAVDSVTGGGGGSSGGSNDVTSQPSTSPGGGRETSGSLDDSGPVDRGGGGSSGGGGGGGGSSGGGGGSSGGGGGGGGSSGGGGGGSSGGGGGGGGSITQTVTNIGGGALDRVGDIANNPGDVVTGGITAGVDAFSNIGSDSDGGGGGGPRTNNPTQPPDLGVDVTAGNTNGEFDPDGINTTRTVDEGNVSQEINQTVGQRVGEDLPLGGEVGVGDIAIGQQPETAESTIEQTTQSQRDRIRQNAAEDSIFQADEIGLGQINDDGRVNIRTPDTRADINVDANRASDFQLGNQPTTSGDFGTQTATSTDDQLGSLTVGAPTDRGETEIVGLGEDFPTSFEELSSTDFGTDEVLSTDLPTGQREIERAVSGTAQDALGVNIPRDIERRTATATTDFLADTAGVSDDGFDIDDSALADNQQAQTAAGLAATAVATPEPVSTGGGAAVLGGLALGAGAVGVANELGTPDDRDANGGFGTQELEINEPTTATTELGIGSIDTNEFDTPTDGGFFDGGELSPPSGSSTGSRNPAEQPFETGELVQPDLVEDEPEEVIILPEDNPSIFDGEESFQGDYVRRRQEQFDLPDRRENRDAFVFPGEPVESGFGSGEGFEQSTESGFGEGFGTGQGPFAGQGGLGATVTGQAGAFDLDTTPGLGEVSASALLGDTTQTVEQTQTETTTEDLFENEYATPTQPSTRNRRRASPPLRPFFPGGDNDEEGSPLFDETDDLIDSGILSGEEALDDVGGFDRGPANTPRQVDGALDDVFPGAPNYASRNDRFSL